MGNTVKLQNPQTTRNSECSTNKTQIAHRLLTDWSQHQVSSISNIKSAASAASSQQHQQHQVSNISNINPITDCSQVAHRLITNCLEYKISEYSRISLITQIVQVVQKDKNTVNIQVFLKS